MMPPVAEVAPLSYLALAHKMLHMIGLKPPGGA